MKSRPLSVWLLQNLSSHTPSEVYEDTVLSCSDEEIDAVSAWLSSLMAEFDEAILDV